MSTRTPRCVAFLRLPILALALSLSSAVSAQSLLQEPPTPTLGLPIQGLPGSAIASDLDGDGDDDLLVAEGNTLVVLRMQAGTFLRQPITSPTALNLALLASADFDGDGFVDLAVGVPQPFQPLLRIWWGDGSGMFPTASPTDVVINPGLANGPIAAADVDGDADVDFVLHGEVVFGVVTSALVRNLGNRTFAVAPAAQFPNLDTGVATPFVVDVDGDGAKDVVWVSRNARTRLFWNNAGNFAEATTAQFPLLQRSLRGLAVADFDGDGDLDLVLGGDNETGVLLRTTGLRQLTLDPNPATGIHTLALRAGDADGDGDVDLHVFSRDQDETWTNDGSGSFTPTANWGSNEDVRFVTAVDLDDDGDVDHLRFGASSSTTQPQVVSITAVYTVAPGRYDYAVGNRLPISTNAVGTAAGGDIDGDGRTDLLVGNSEPQLPSMPLSTIQFARGNSNGTFTFHWANRVGGIDNGFFADLTGDGRDEYVFTGTSAGYLVNDGGTLGTTPVPLPLPPIGTVSAGTSLDIDGDGDQDLVFAMQLGSYSVLRTLVNHAGTFVDESSTRLNGPPADGQYAIVRAADLDGDQDVDLWLCTANHQQIWRNENGTLVFVPAAIPINAWGNGVGAGSSIGDFDGDGDLDLQIGRKLLFNAGNATFVPLVTIPNTTGNESLTFAADIDDDGDLDLLGSGVSAWNNGAGGFTNANNVLPFAWGTGNGVRQVLDVDLDGDPDAVAVFNNRPALLLNQLRQLQLAGPALLGGNAALTYSIRPGSVPLPVFAWLAFSFATIAPQQVPGLGWVQIDPSSLSLRGAFALPATGGEVTHQEPIPNSPALLGTLLAVQPLELRGNRLRLGNLVTTYLGR